MSKDSKNSALIPTHKMDWDAIDRLESASSEQIKMIAVELLQWVQDYNWPITPALAVILSRQTNVIKEELISVLRTNDVVWKSVCLSLIIEASDVSNLDNLLLEEVQRIALHPTIDEQEDEQDEIANRILMHWQFQK